VSMHCVALRPSVTSAALRRVAQKLRHGTARLRWHGAPAVCSAHAILASTMTTRTSLARKRPALIRRSSSARGWSARSGAGRQPRRLAPQAAPLAPAPLASSSSNNTGCSSARADANVAALSSVLARTAQALSAQTVPRTVFWTDRWSPA
jgi:hypothetical protein